MTPELKRKWIEALRSGKYEQGRSYLRQRVQEGDRFCCLGVLCDVMGEKWLNESGPTTGAVFTEDYSISLLSCSELDRAKLARGEAIELASMNDDGKAFPEIADYIEKNIP